MERTQIGDLRKHIGETVRIQGWLQTLRDQKKMQFLVVRDMSGLVQVVVEKARHARRGGGHFRGQRRIGADHYGQGDR